MLINSINSGLDRSYLDYLPGYITKYSDLDLLELSRAESFTELVKLLRTTEYYKPLVRVRLADDGTVDYTECERQLRTSYYARILKQAEKSFSDEEKDEMIKMLKDEIDLLNMINAYRMKAFFDFTPQQIKQHQIKLPGVGKKLDSYYELDTPEQMLDWLSRNKAHQEFSDGTKIEVIMQRNKFKRLEHILYRSSHASVVLYAFTQLCDFELSNITHIIEGTRYGVDPVYIENELLVC